MTTSGYANGAQLWQAVTDRAKANKARTGKNPEATIREYVMSRFLARVFHDPAGPWVLKGGTATLMRVRDARATKDVDLFARLGDLDAAVAALLRAVKVDLGDHFRFQPVGRPTATLTGQADTRGVTLAFEVYVGAAQKNRLNVDLVTGSLMTTEPDTLTVETLTVGSVVNPTVRVYPVVDHIADKLCATQARYGVNGERPSSRVKDLVDLVVFARTSSLDGAELITAIEGEWTHRRLAGTPAFAPPPDWAPRYTAQARKTPACGEITQYAAAVTLVHDLLDPVFDHSAVGRRWRPDTRVWAPHS